MGILNNIKSTVIGGVSDVLSAPARMKALRSKQQADSDVSALKTARSYKNAPTMDKSGTPTRAGMAQSLASDVRTRLTGKYK